MTIARMLRLPGGMTALAAAVDRRLRRAGRRPAGWLDCERGVSAVEFALFAPILGFVLLASIDLGLAVSERMAIDHVLRSGAQSAITDPGEAATLDVMSTTAQANFTLADEESASGSESLTLSATRYCACPEDAGYAVACSTVCMGSEPTFIYYRMTASKTYAGWIVPVFDFDRAVQVQIR